MKPLLVGEAPGRNGDPCRPLEGKVGRRLAALFGLTFDGYLEAFVRTNLLDFWPGQNGKGAAFVIVDAEMVACTLVRKRFKRGRVVLLLGKRVARAFGTKGDYFDEQVVNGARVYVVPHPSGVNRWYNDSTNVEHVRRFMKQVVRPTHDRRD